MGKFQEGGAGGIAEVKAALDDSKIQFFLFRVTGIDERAGAKSIRTKYVKGCMIGPGAPAIMKAKMSVLNKGLFDFLGDAHQTLQMDSADSLTEEDVEKRLRAAAGAHQVQRFDFTNAEARNGRGAAAAE